jgi:hypothetical protein
MTLPLLFVTRTPEAGKTPGLAALFLEIEVDRATGKRHWRAIRRDSGIPSR